MADNNDNHKLFEVIANEAIMGFLTFDLESNTCIFANNLAKEIIELSPSDSHESITLESLFPPTRDMSNDKMKDFKNFNSDLVQHEGLYQGVLVKKRNGHQFIASLGVKKLHMNNQEHLLIMLQDTTIQNKLQREVINKQNEIKAAFEEVLKQNEQLLDLDKAKNRFISLTTHELRTPLSAMVASTEIVKDKLYDNEEQHDEFIEMIFEQGHHLMELVNDILDFSKIQAGRMDYYINQCNLNELMEKEIDTHTNVAEQDNIKLTYEIPADDPICYYDDLRLRQVISNIISNAIKYNNKDGWVKIWTEQDDDFVTLYVQDSGKGISADNTDKVFDEFETLGKVALHHEGTGLGMPISKQLTEAMGGEISLSSEEGVGSKFWITIPKHKILDEKNYGKRPDDILDLIA